MRRISSIMLAFIMLFSQIVYDYNYVQAEEGATDIVVTEDISSQDVFTADVESQDDLTLEGVENYTEATEQSSLMAGPTMVGTQMYNALANTVSDVGSITFSNNQDLIKPAITVTVATGGKKVLGVTYDRGYAQKANKNSKRVYGHEGKQDDFSFVLDDVMKYVSVYVLFTDGTYLVKDFALDSKRVYNSGGASFSPHPTTPLNNSTNMDTIISDKVGDATGAGADNGPMVLVDDQVWVFGNEETFYTYDIAKLDGYFGLKGSKYDVPRSDYTKSSNARFSEGNSEIIYDGRWVIGVTQYGGLLAIDAQDPSKQYWSRFQNNGLSNEPNKVFTNFTSFNQDLYYTNETRGVKAIVYDNINIYIIGYTSVYVARPNGDGTYTIDTTPLGTWGGSTSYPQFIDATFDGESIWITNNTSSLSKFTLNYDGDGKVISGSNINPKPTYDRSLTSIVYDGSKYIYSLGINGETGFVKIDKDNPTSYDKIMGTYKPDNYLGTNVPDTDTTSNVVAGGNNEDIMWDGRNIWITSYARDQSNRQRYDTVTGSVVRVPRSRMMQDTDSSVAYSTYHDNNAVGLYDGKYAWFFRYLRRDINVFGRLIDLGYGASATAGSNLVNLTGTTTVYVDDKDTTSPNYVEISTKAGFSTSDIAYAAWTYDADEATAKTRDFDFFSTLENLTFDGDFDGDWKLYNGTAGKYFTFSGDLPKVDASGKFTSEFTFNTLPKKNGYYTLYMINKEGRPYVETIKVTNYVDIARLYINFVDDQDSSIVIQNMDESYAKGSSPTIKTDKFVDDLAAMGYVISGEKSKTITLGADSQEVNFLVTKDRTKWTEIIIKPWYTDSEGNRVDLDPIYTGKYYLVSDPYDSSSLDTGLEGKYHRFTMVDAPHIPGYGIADVKSSPVKTDLPVTNGGTNKGTLDMSDDEYGKTFVEFEYKLFGSFVNIKGVEVKDGELTGNIVYTDQVEGSVDPNNDGSTADATVTAKTDLENWDLSGLAILNADGTLSSISNNVSTKDIIFGKDSEVVFAYTRKMATVKVEYYEVGDDSKTITTTDTFEVPLNTEFTAVGKAIDGFKLADGVSYLQRDVLVNKNPLELSFAYERIMETVIIEAKDGDGNVIGRDSIDLPLGTTQDVNVDDLADLLKPRYELVTTSPQSVDVVDGTVVSFVFKEMLADVTVNYYEKGNASKVVATQKTYKVPYGDKISEYAISVSDYYIASGDVSSYPEVIANDTKYTYNFEYTKSAGDIIVMAKDQVTGAILEYKIFSGTQGTALNFDVSTGTGKGDGFAGNWKNNYTLKDASSSQTLTYTDSLQEMVFNYKMETYTVTLYAALDTADGDQLAFFDGKTEKVFTYNINSKYSLYAPPVVGHVIKEGTSSTTSNTTGITKDEEYTFIYEKINTEVNLAVKAVAENGDIVGAKTVQDDRGDNATIKILADGTFTVNDGTGVPLFDSTKWKIKDGSITSKDIIFGSNHEVSFILERKTVTLTVEHWGTTASGSSVLLDSNEYIVPVGSTEKVASELFHSYQLADDQQSFDFVEIGSSDITYKFNYVKSVGNVILQAVDSVSGVILEQRVIDVLVDTTNYVLPQSEVDKFTTHDNVAYDYDTTSDLKLDIVSETANDNIIILYFDPAKVTITVKYVNEVGEDVESASVYEVIKGSYVDEYAVNIPFHNLLDQAGNEAFREIKSALANETITFVYEEILIPDGVVNIYAKNEDGEILDVKSYRGTVGDQELFVYDYVFPDGFTGYKIKGNTELSVVYANGFVNIEFIYEKIEWKVNIKAVLEGTTTDLPFNVGTVVEYTVQDSSDITIYAPHIDGYILVGDESQTLNAVTKHETVTFKYAPIGDIVVLKGIEVDASGKPVDPENVVYASIVTGNNLQSQTIDAIDGLSNWTLVGLIDGGTATAAKSKDVVFGTDNEVVFGYTRNMITVTVKYLEKDSNGKEVATLDTITLPSNTSTTLTAKAVEGYELVDFDQYKLEISNIGASDVTYSFYYKKLEKTVAIKAVLDTIDGELLAQYTVDLPLGATDQVVSADDIAGLLSPRYSLVGSSDQTITTVETDTVVTYIFKENISTITVNYFAADGTPIATALTYDVPYGTYVSESAISIKDYYFDTTRPANNPTETIAEVLADSYTLNFYYTRAYGNISVIARDGSTGEILYYKTYSDAQDEILNVNASTEFASEDFIKYYTLDGAYTDHQWLKFTESHQEIVYEYNRVMYNVTISAKDIDTDQNLTFDTGKTTLVYPYTSGDTYKIYAPPIDGYYVDQSSQSYILETKGITENVEHTFKYKKIELGTNITIKAVSEDGVILIGTKIVSKPRETVETIAISDHSELYNSEEWILSSSSAASIDVTYGTDKEAVFKFIRKTVNATVNYVDANGVTLKTSDVFDGIPTNTTYTAVAEVIENFVLQSGQKQSQTAKVGTIDHEFTFVYVPASGNVIIEAVDADTDELILARKYVNADEGTTYTVDPSIKSEFNSQLIGYQYDTSSVEVIQSVSPDAKNNVIKLKYKKIMSDITVSYMDANGNKIAPDKTYQVQYGRGFDEYALNFEQYNLLSNESHIAVSTVDQPKYDITFVYYLDDACVINVVAKTTDGQLLAMKPFIGIVDSEKVFDSSEIFDIIGYKLANGEAGTKGAIFKNGLVTVEFLYEVDELKVTIAAEDESGNTLPFNEPATISTKVGDTLKVYAPHVSVNETVDGYTHTSRYEVVGYKVGGSDTVYEAISNSIIEIKNISDNVNVTFIYKKIDVHSEILVKHVTFLSGRTIILKAENATGNVGEVVSIFPLTSDEQALFGVAIDPAYDYEIIKIFEQGENEEVVIPYTTNMSTLLLKYVVEMYNSSTDVQNNVVERVLTEADKRTSAPQLLNVTETYVRDTTQTVVAPFEGDFVINLGKNTTPIRDKVLLHDPIITKNYYYRNITGNVLIRAVVQDDKGSLTIDGVNYRPIAQIDDDCAVGTTYGNATMMRSTLEDLLMPSYIYDSSVGLITGSEKFIPNAGDTYLDHTLTYVFTGDYKKVSVTFKDTSGNLINPSYLGVESNPLITYVINGDYFTHYALDVLNYNYVGSRVSNAKGVVRSNSFKPANDSDLDSSPVLNYEITQDMAFEFIYEKFDFTTPTDVVQIIDGERVISNITITPGQTLYAPYVNGYEPSPKFYVVDANTPASEYVFTYTKVIPETITETIYKNIYRTNTETVTVYEDRFYNNDVYIGDAVPFEHKAYIKGYENGTVKPDGTITRAEVVSILFNLLYDDAAAEKYSNTTRFSDVNDDAWYSDMVYKMASKGYITGYEDGTFKPQQEITREEIATILSRIYGTGRFDVVVNLPLDPKGWATEYIFDAYSSEFYDDINITDMDWKEKATRAEVIVMVNNATNRVPSDLLLTINNVIIPEDLHINHWAYLHIIEAMNDHYGYYLGNFGEEEEVLKFEVGKTVQ